MRVPPSNTGTLGTRLLTRGALLFFGKANCVACPATAWQANEMFSDFQPHRTDRGEGVMDLVTLREEYDLARCYTQSLYEDLSESEVQWRPAPNSSGIAWHLGHQAMVTHLLLRNLIAGEPSLNPQFDLLFDAARPQEARGGLPPLAAIVAYRDAVAQRTHTHLTSVLEDSRAVAHNATQQVARLLVPLVVSLINHEYQHDCWIREMRALLSRAKPDSILSQRVSQRDGYWGLP